MTDNLPEFDELNNIRYRLTEMVLPETADGTKPEPRIDRKRLEDTIFELITMGYVYGITVAGLDLETDLPVSAERMREVADTPTKGETFRERMATHFDEYERSVTDNPEATERLINQLSVIAETETHRAINTGGLEGAEEYQKSHPGAMVLKQWRTMLDDRVRETHDWLEGATIPLDARFYSFDGDSALKPGDFMLAENNVNCRCILRYITA